MLKLSKARPSFKNSAPPILHTGANTVQGGSLAWQRLIPRPQINGSESFTKPGWMASHGTG